MTTRRITVSEMDYIGPLKTYGPIVTPTYFDERIVHQLVQRNYTVTEYSVAPATKGKKVKLTISNFNDPKRFDDGTIRPVDRTNITGAAAVGKATIVNPVAPEAPVDVPQEKVPEETPVTPTEETPATPEVKEAPVANPINTSGMTKKQRKELARKAAEEKAKADKENAEANAAADEQINTELPATEETTGPQSLKD